MIIAKVNSLIFVGYAVLVAYVSLQPGGNDSIGSFDKAAHLITYFIFAVLAYRLPLSSRQLIALCVAIVAYSGLMEFGQSYVPGREMSGLDFVANSLGVLAGGLLCRTVFGADPKRVGH